VTPSVAERWGDVAATANSCTAAISRTRATSSARNVRVQYKLKLDDARRLKLYGKLGTPGT